jgi:hypothetical protein
MKIAFFADAKIAPCSQTWRQSVRHGLRTLHEGSLYTESFAPDCWLKRSTPVPFRLGNDGETIGEISVIVPMKEWFHASVAVYDGPLAEVAREKVRPGAKVSIGFRELVRDQDRELLILRHTLARMDELALLDERDIPGHIGATITRVYEPRTKPAARTARNGWRALLPAGWSDLANDPGFELQPGTELLDQRGRTLYRWTGEKFVRPAHLIRSSLPPVELEEEVIHERNARLSRHFENAIIGLR